MAYGDAHDANARTHTRTRSCARPIRRIDNETGQQVAIKTVDLEDARDGLEDLQHEVALMASFDSGYVTRYYGSFVVERELWIIMEYMSGGSVYDLVRGAGRTPAPNPAPTRALMDARPNPHVHGRDARCPCRYRTARFWRSGTLRSSCARCCTACTTCTRIGSCIAT